MGRRREPRKEIQEPVRIFGTDSSGQVFSAKAVTVNVSQQGIELSGVESRLNLDEIIGLTYGKNRVALSRQMGRPAGNPKSGSRGLAQRFARKASLGFSTTLSYTRQSPATSR
jgi:hypothetical protein